MFELFYMFNDCLRVFKCCFPKCFICFKCVRFVSVLYVFYVVFIV